MEKYLPWLWLALQLDITPQVRLQLVQQVGTPAFLYAATPEEYGQSLSTDLIRLLCNKDLTHARKVWEDCQTHQIQLICWEDADYPTALRTLEDAPLVLYLRGELPDFVAHPPITFVGTRAVSPYGMEMITRFVGAFAAGGFSFVVGTSLGVETTTLTVACKQAAPVLAIQVGGVELDYPRENATLCAHLAQYGGILSEEPPGTGNEGFRFKERNRLLCALSLAVILVEAPPQSGALSAMDWANALGKPAYAIPSRLDAPNHAGNLLIRDGVATLLTDPNQIVQDIMPFLKIVPPYREIIKSFHRGKRNDMVDEPSKMGKVKRPKPEPAPIKVEPPVLSPEQQKIADAVRQGAHNIDAIGQQVAMPVDAVLSELTMMEILGMVENIAGLYHWIE